MSIDRPSRSEDRNPSTGCGPVVSDLAKPGAIFTHDTGYSPCGDGEFNMLMCEFFDCCGPCKQLPDMPHLELEAVGPYALAKMKGAVIAITGG